MELTQAKLKLLKQQIADKNLEIANLIESFKNATKNMKIYVRDTLGKRFKILNPKPIFKLIWNKYQTFLIQFKDHLCLSNQ